MKIFDGVMSRIFVREFIIFLKFAKLLAIMLICTHLAACAWFFAGYTTIHHSSGSWLSILFGHSDTDLIDAMSAFDKYSYSWYWAVVTVNLYALSLFVLSLFSVFLCIS